VAPAIGVPVVVVTRPMIVGAVTALAEVVTVMTV
jgi:hypothetical protein